MNVKKLEITVDDDYAQMNVWTTDNAKVLEASVFSKVLRAFNEVTQSVAFSHRRTGFWSSTEPRNESSAQFILATRWVVLERKNASSRNRDADLVGEAGEGQQGVPETDLPDR